MVTLGGAPSHALTRADCRALGQVLDRVDADTDVRCLVVTGTGRVFCAGADLREERGLAADELAGFLAGFAGTLDRLQDLRVPVVAAVNGAAVGGGLELALCCDVRIAADEAFFVAAGVNVGLMASVWRLPRVVGLGPATEMLLTGGRYTARQAAGWGLVTGVHPAADLLPAALTLARRIATRPPLSVEATKAAAARALERDRSEATALQHRALLQLVATEDHAEAVQAFLDERDGVYRRR
nr:enoyl-CoA hydratase/isomerase family protein [Geodermatophilus sabuli]